MESWRAGGGNRRTGRGQSLHTRGVESRCASGGKIRHACTPAKHKIICPT